MNIIRVLLSSVVLLLAVAVQPAMAFNFGNEEDLHPLVEIGVVGAKNEPLSLGYKTTTQNFLLPYTMSDDGYVLIVRGESDKYYDATPEELKVWQEQGLVPDPLPAYEISMLDRIMGYLLWPTLVVVALVYLIGWMRRKKPAAVGEPTPMATPDAAPGLASDATARAPGPNDP